MGLTKISPISSGMNGKYTSQVAGGAGSPIQGNSPMQNPPAPIPWGDVNPSGPINTNPLLPTVPNPSTTPGNTGTGNPTPTGPVGPDYNEISNNWFGGRLGTINTSPYDARGTRSQIADYFGRMGLGGISASNPTAPGRAIIGDVPTTQSLDQLGPGSMFFQRIQEQLDPVFAQRRAQALAQAKESAGNLTGSSFANILGSQVNKSLAEERADLLRYATEAAGLEQQRQLGMAGLGNTRNINQGQLDTTRGLNIYNTDANTSNANAQRFLDLLGRFSTTGVGPNEVVSESGVGALLAPLLGLLGNSGFASGGGADGQGNLGTIGDIGGWLKDHFGGLFGGGNNAPPTGGGQLPPLPPSPNIPPVNVPLPPSPISTNAPLPTIPPAQQPPQAAPPYQYTPPTYTPPPASYNPTIPPAYNPQDPYGINTPDNKTFLPYGATGYGSSKYKNVY